MASTAVKKKQKMKGKTLNLNEFLADESGTSGPGSSYVLAAKPMSWGEQMEGQDMDGDEMPDYGMSRGPPVDRSKLPSAPRSARGADFDPSRVPTRPPFTAFLGNLQYDICEEDIERFFQKLKLVNIRLPQEQGRMKGFGYAEFEDRESLIDALSLNDTELNNRKVRIDMAEQNQGGDRDRDRGQWREGDEDRTTGDWRTKPMSSDSSFGGDDRYGSRGGGGGGYDDRGGDRGRFGDRDRGYGGDRDGGGSRYGGDRDGGGRWGGDRDRGGSSFGGDRDRDGGGRWGGDRDRGGSSFGGDRDGGGRWGGDRDRGGSSFGGDRDRDGGGRWGGDRDRDGGGSRFGGGRDGGDRGGDRYDDRDQGRRQFGSGYGGDRGGDRDSYRSGGDSYRSNNYDRERNPETQDSEPKERPRLQLQPRSKPAEDSQAANKSASIFGGAKPVDTAAREREIEERLFKQRHLSEKPAEPSWQRNSTTSSSGDRPRPRRDSGGDRPHPRRDSGGDRPHPRRDSGGDRPHPRRDSGGDRPHPRRDSGGDRPHTRRDSGSSVEGGPSSSTSSTRRERLHSSDSSKGFRTVAPPPGAGSARVRSDSGLSDDTDVHDDDRHQRTVARKLSSDQSPTIVPAPPPKTNVWEKRKSETRGSQDEDPRETHKADDGKTCERETERQKEEKEQENRETKESLQTTEVEKAPKGAPPAGNVWEKRQKDRDTDHPEIETTTSEGQ